MATTKLILASAVTLCVMSSQSFAEVKLPASAKKLTTEEIQALYAGSKSTWKNHEGFTGTAEISADGKTGKGTLVNPEGKTLNWDSKITYKKNQYCFSVRVGDMKKYFPPQCKLVFVVDKTAYEVNPKSKKVESVNSIQ